jgi:hypothetical protein
MTIARRVRIWFAGVLHRKFRRNETAMPTVTEEEHITQALGQYESYIIKLQRVLIWEKPLTSILCVLGVNLLFW